MLIKEDYNLLIEALEAWEHKDFASSLMTDLLEGLIGSKDSKFVEERKRKKQQAQQEYELAQRERKERSTLLKAKLISIRESMTDEQGNFISGQSQH